MANWEHLKLIKQGSEGWNSWTQRNPDIKPDLFAADLTATNLSATNLSGANLAGTTLSGANLSGANLNGANLSLAALIGANLSEANLSGANLSQANLSETDLRGTNLSRTTLSWATLRSATLSGADLSGADLSSANLSHADLSAAKLTGADLSQADLSSVNLSGSDLSRANLSGANLSGSDLSGSALSGANLSSANLGWANLSRAVLRQAVLSRATVGYTIFGNNDLSTVKALETVRHRGPSTIGIDTLFKSLGQLPEMFLRGCGLSDWEIEASKLHRSDLTNEEIGDAVYRIHDLRAHQAIQISSLFISYSHIDDPFVNQMESYFVKSGIRFWRDVHHATAGRLERQVDRAIRLNPTVLVVLSKDSVRSDWVEHEVRLARKLAKEIKRDVLCPVALDESWKDCEWPGRLREQIMEFNILDFSNWRDASYFDRMYGRLIEGLNLFYTKGEHT